MNSLPYLVDRQEWQASQVEANEIAHGPYANLQAPMTIAGLDSPIDMLDALTQSLDGPAVDGDLADKMRVLQLFEQDGSLEDTTKNRFVANVILEKPQTQEVLRLRNLEAEHRILRETWPDFISRFKDGLARGIGFGYLPADILPRFDSASRDTRVVVVDEGIIQNILGWASAAYDTEEDTVLLNRTDMFDREYIIENLGHEFVHKLGGGSFVQESSTKAPVRNRIGFSGFVSQATKMTRTHLEEAVTTHTNEAILAGDFEIVDPLERKHTGPDYQLERIVLDILIKKSGGLLNIRQFIAARLEDSGPDGSYEARRDLVRSIQLAYGSRALHDYEAVCDIAGLYNDYGIANIAESNIHSPEFDDSGKLVKSGRIETDFTALR